LVLLEDAQGKLTPVLERGVSSRWNGQRRAVLPNGAMFVVEISALLSKRAFPIEDAVGYVMPHSKSIDIDDNIDFELAELMLRRRLRQEID